MNSPLLSLAAAQEVTGQWQCHHSQCASWLIFTFSIQNNSCPVTRLESNCILLMFFSWQPRRQGWVDYDFRFQCLFSNFHFSVITFSVRGLQFLLFAALLRHSSPNLSVTFNATLTQFLSSSPPFPSNTCTLLLCLFFILHSFHTSSPFQYISHQFILNIFLHSNLLSQLSHFSVISSLRSHDSSYSVVFANLHLLPLFLC